MYNALGYGKGDTILAALIAGIGLPAYVPVVLTPGLHSTDIVVLLGL